MLDPPSTHPPTRPEQGQPQPSCPPMQAAQAVPVAPVHEPPQPQPQGPGPGLVQQDAGPVQPTGAGSTSCGGQRRSLTQLQLPQCQWPGRQAPSPGRQSPSPTPHPLLAFVVSPAAPGAPPTSLLSLSSSWRSSGSLCLPTTVSTVVGTPSTLWQAGEEHLATPAGRGADP